MKKALALIGTIIFVFSIVPMGAFATDSDYSDHTSNIAPYVDTIIRGFTDSNDTVRHTLSITDVELWQAGLPLGQYQLTAQVPADCDVIDIDFTFDAADLMTDQYYQLFDVYITGLVNIDYIEFYQHSTYRSFPIYYATYHQNRLYVMTAANVLQSGGYTLRVHIKRGGFTVSYYNNILPYVYLRQLTDFNSTSTLAEWYYLTNLLRELDSLEFNVSTVSVDFSNLQTTINYLYNIISNNYNYWTRYAYHADDAYTYKAYILYNIVADDVAYPQIKSLNEQSSGNTTVYIDNIDGDNTFYIGFNTAINIYPYSLFNQFFFPISSYSINPYTDIHVTWSTGAQQTDSSRVESLYFQNPYPATWRIADDVNGNRFLLINTYNYAGTANLNSPGGMVWFKFQCSISNGSSQITFKNNISYDLASWHTVSYTDKMLGSTKAIEFMLNQLTEYIMSGALSGGVDSGNYPSYPSGPSDPQDPNQTTNIYDVNIEFNTQVGDISVFENTYSQQLPTYDQSISDQYLVPVSNSYDFSDLNSTFNSIWSSSFQYDTDEEDNIVGVYGLGLYFIIPLVLLVLFALFRRVTS